MNVPKGATLNRVIVPLAKLEYLHATKEKGERDMRKARCFSAAVMLAVLAGSAWMPARAAAPVEHIELSADPTEYEGLAL